MSESCTISGLADRILCHINDADEERFNKEDIIGMINDGAAAIMSRDEAEEDFATIQEVTLVAKDGDTCIFDLSYYCEKILKVISQDNDCNTRHEEDEIRNDVFSRYIDFCSSQEPYRLQHWRIENKTTLVVSPALPEGETLTISVSCVENIKPVCPEQDGGALPQKLCTKYSRLLWNFVLERFYSSYQDDPDAVAFCQKFGQAYQIEFASLFPVTNNAPVNRGQE